MRKYIGIIAFTVTISLAFGQTVPSPSQFLGFGVGADQKLARWDRIVDYMQTVAKGSGRVQFHEVGKTTSGNPFVLMVISSPGNLKNLEQLKAINRRVFDPRTIADVK